jgi:hypothetical protein
MAKQEIRKIVASSDIAGLIDRGAEIDTELKNLTFQDKGHKKQITTHVENLIEDDETSVRVEGNLASALVTAMKQYSFVATHEKAKEVTDAAEKGILGGAVKVIISVRIPPADMARAVEVLNEAGIPATLTKSYDIEAKNYREFSDEVSPEVAAIKDILDECIDETTSFRVKYEKKGE